MLYKPQVCRCVTWRDHVTHQCYQNSVGHSSSLVLEETPRPALAAIPAGHVPRDHYTSEIRCSSNRQTLQAIDIHWPLYDRCWVLLRANFSCHVADNRLGVDSRLAFRLPVHWVMASLLLSNSLFGTSLRPCIVIHAVRNGGNYTTPYAFNIPAPHGAIMAQTVHGPANFEEQTRNYVKYWSIQLLPLRFFPFKSTFITPRGSAKCKINNEKKPETTGVQNYTNVPRKTVKNIYEITNSCELTPCVNTNMSPPTGNHKAKEFLCIYAFF